MPVKPPSSTSSSDARPTAFIVVTLVFLAAGLLAVELGFRALLPHLSANSRILAASRARVETIADADTPTMLILGNSVSGDGVDPTLLATELADRGLPFAIAHQPADNTVMRDWFYQLDNQFIRADAAPDVLLLPLGTIPPLTRLNERTEDLLFSFLRLADLPEFLQRADVYGFEERSGIVFGKLSALHAFRGRLQKRVLVELIPGYETLRMAMLEAGTTTDGEFVVRSDKRWAKLMARLTERADIRVVLALVPTEPLDRGLPSSDAKLAARLDWPVLDPGRDVTWDGEDRPDGLHLGPDARERYTRLLAAELAELLAPTPGETR